MFDEFKNDNSPDIDQQIRINELREAAREAAGGEMVEWESEDTTPELAESFWSHVLAYEEAEKTCHFFQLEDLGISLPPPEELSEHQLPGKLEEIFTGLARLNTFVTQTDHLSDRQLYEHLWYDTLREVTPDLPPKLGWNCHIDMVSSGSEEDIENYLKYYADAEERARWEKEFPEDSMPVATDPPYDRDSKLPKSAPE